MESQNLRRQLNLGNSIFSGRNDHSGLMLCGYEWGYSKSDQATDALNQGAREVAGVPHTFSAKFLEHGEVANTWPYDRRLKKWFALWGHPLAEHELGGDFEKSIVQTNWCDSQGHQIEGSYEQKLLAPEAVDNFITHIETLKPSVILFLGSKMLSLLQHSSVIKRFEAVVGKRLTEPSVVTKPFEGKRFKVGFQKFEKTEVVCLPHPSGSHGLNDAYISLFSDEIGSVIAQFKTSRSIGN